MLPEPIMIIATTLHFKNSWVRFEFITTHLVRASELVARYVNSSQVAEVICRPRGLRSERKARFHSVSADCVESRQVIARPAKTIIELYAPEFLVTCSRKLAIRQPQLWTCTQQQYYKGEGLVSIAIVAIYLSATAEKAESFALAIQWFTRRWRQALYG